MAKGENIPTRFSGEELAAIRELVARYGIKNGEVIRRSVRLFKRMVEEQGLAEILELTSRPMKPSEAFASLRDVGAATAKFNEAPKKAQQ